MAENNETPDIEFEIDPETAEKLTELSEKLQSIDIGGGDIIMYMIIGVVCFWLFGGMIGMIFEMIFALFEAIFWVIWHFIKGCWWVVRNGFRAGNSLSSYMQDARLKRKIRQDDEDKEILNPTRKERKKNRPVDDPFDVGDDFSDFD